MLVRSPLATLLLLVALSRLPQSDLQIHTPIGNTIVEVPNQGCALLLRRSYLGATGAITSTIPGAVVNVIGPQPATTHEICIRYADVNQAMAVARRRINYIHPVQASTNPQPDPRIIDPTARLSLEVTTILAHQFRLTPDEILNGLPLIDISRTEMWDYCPAFAKPVPCTIGRYRTYNGLCNNVEHPYWGTTFTPFVRFLPPVYADGISAPRVSVVDGSPLPNPRLVSNFVHRDYDYPSGHLSILLMSWGQFIDHDLTLAAPPRDENDLDFYCCGVPPERRHHDCMTIDIPLNDPFFSHYGQHCMEFKRTVPGHRPLCALGPRVHVNILTSSIDANFIYGSTDELAHKLRLHQGGLMRTSGGLDHYGLKPLLPPLDENPERDCLRRPRSHYCYIAGDERVNEQIHLTVLHTMYIRDHNRVATELSLLNPHWDDEKIFQEARHIIAASVQHITYNEFLPLLIGEDLCNRYNLTLKKEGYWNLYDPTINLGLSNAFQSSAFRFGHTFIQGMVRRYNKFHEMLGEDHLRGMLRHPFITHEPGKMDELVGGLVNTPAQSYDPFITQEVTNHLFQEHENPFGMDLAAINMARGREHGVPGYNLYREWCGLPRAHTFEELEPWLNNGTAYKYAQMYKHPDDIDLWSAGVSERPLPGGLIGPTFACIIARQFNNLRRGDRFWYENSGLPSSFTPEQLREIRKSTQAKIICQNADDMPTMQLWVMRMPHPIYNPRLRCDDMPAIDLRYWKEDIIQGGYFPYKKK